jgi:DNA ligase (NAD+)
MEAGREQLIEVHEIGDRIADSILSYFSDDRHRYIIHRLQQHGLQFALEQTTEKLSTLLEDKSFVISGVFSSFSRDEAKKLIEQHGGRVVGSISAKTDFILAGDQMGPSKKEKAEKLNIRMIDEHGFLLMIGRNDG